ncbi:MAG TPA: hypothetical protein VNT02_04400 [Burkholderiales bacterium]|nr:hypothetical protein [Burkholderiales bacterium]
MAAGSIITVLSNIPWGQVVDNAPKVADGAARLWNAVKNRRKTRPGDDAEGGPNSAPSERDVLEQRLVALEENVRSLQEQMQASTELIKTLAEANTLLVQRIELNRQRTIRLAVALGVVGAAVLGMVGYLLMR